MVIKHGTDLDSYTVTVKYQTVGGKNRAWGSVKVKGSL